MMAMDYIVHLGILCAVYVVTAWSLDILVGRLGIFSLAHAAFLGIGAYTYALARTRLGFGAVIGLALAVVLSLLLGVIAAKPAGRLKAEQAMLFTIALQGIFTELLFNLESLTGGTYGIVGIISPELPVLGTGLYGQAFVAGALFLGGLGFFMLVHRSVPGLAMRAVGENELLANAVGINASRVRGIGFALSGANAGMAGAFLAGYLTFIDPNSFNLNESIFLVTALLVGGSGNLVGPAVGMVIILLLPELLRAIAVSPAIVGNLQKTFFAVILIVLMRIRPQGLAGGGVLR